MKRRIVAMILAVITVLMCCAFTSAGANEKIVEPEVVVEYVTRTVEVKVDKSFKIDRIEEFEDPNLNTYTMAQLQVLIEAERADQEAAHELAESARKLGWSEESEPIASAKNEWWNAQLAIEVYDARYKELYAESEEAKWATKAAEYPAATQIWRYMKDLGWNDYVCAGIMGNLMAEVGGQTLDIQYWLKGNGYYGMCQWNKAYCNGVWGADLTGQCNFLRDTIKYEIDTFGYAYKKGFNLDSFLAMSNERDAALAFAKCYERCGSGSYTIRQNNAEKAYNYFVNN